MNQKINSILAILKLLIPSIIKCKVRSWFAKGCNKGRGVYLHPSVQLIGASNVSIGDNSCIGEDTWINVNRRIKGELEVVIGDHCFIGRRNFFSSGKNIRLGHYTLTTIECKFICSSHLADNPLIPYIASGTTFNQAINIGANCFFGVGAIVLGNVSIGCGSIIGSASMVTTDVPSFSIVIGNPARVIKRYSFAKSCWMNALSVTEEDLAANPSEEEYLRILRDGYSSIVMPRIAAGSDLGNL